jgi:hypothetical protein
MRVYTAFIWLRLASREGIFEQDSELSDLLKEWGGTGYLSRYSDLLRTGRSGDRIPVGERFSTPVQTGSGAHPASYKMGTESFPGGKAAGA